MGLKKRLFYTICSSLIMLLTIALLLTQAMQTRIITSIVGSIIIIAMLIFVFFDEEFSMVQFYAVFLSLLSAAFFTLYTISKPTLTTIFTGIFLIVLSLFFIGMIFINDWQHYRFFDKMIDWMEGRKHH